MTLYNPEKPNEMTNMWLKVDGNLLCKKLYGSNSINFDRQREAKSQQKYTGND